MSGLSDIIFERAVRAISERDYIRAARLLIDFIKVNPENPEGWILRGNAVAAMKQWFEAILHYDRALSLVDNLRDAWYNRGIACMNIGLWQEAERSYNRSIAARETADPHVGLGSMYSSLNRLEDAEREFRKAIELEPSAEYYFKLGLVMQGQGKWEEGLRHYAMRWENNPGTPRALMELPRWNGEDLRGKSILICPEQGYGDEILAMRFADRELLGAREVILQARAPLQKLAESLPNADRVISVHDRYPQCDYVCAALDVILIKGMTWATVLRPYAYLDAPCSRWEREFWWDGLQNLLKVGICWASGTHQGLTVDAAQLKSVPVEMMRMLMHPNVQLVSLQKPPLDYPPDLDLLDQMARCDDFADTARMIEGCDIVVSVDTAVAHLAGALGKPVLNLVRFSGFTPWLLAEVLPDPEYSVWYPTMRLLRQPRLGDWQTPMNIATQTVHALANRRANENSIGQDHRQSAVG